MQKNDASLKIPIHRGYLRKLWIKYVWYSFLSKIRVGSKRNHYISKKKKMEETLAYFKNCANISSFVMKNKSEAIGIPSIAYEEPCPAPLNNQTLKAIAFYLPQFHAIPENDAAWGKGFTEWTNVKKAEPLYHGHYHPKIPGGGLGYYDLRNVGVMRKQAEMARTFGLHGFCFHYYWFSGKRLLELPLESYLADTSINFPFCLNWANENWTRRWDGMENEIIMQQKYSEADDRAVIHDLMRYFRDPRYMRLDGRPVFLVYRPRLFPDMRKTLERWREECAKAGEKTPLFIMVTSDGEYDPSKYGFDAAVEFPPHPTSPSVYIRDLKPQSVSHDFTGESRLYDEVALLNSYYYRPELPSYPCVFPAWDNTAR